MSKVRLVPNAPSQDDILVLQKWFEENRKDLPESIVDILSRLLAVYAYLTQNYTKARKMFTTLRKAMGIIPKSEKRSALFKNSDTGSTQVELNIEDLSSEEREQYEKIRIKRDEHRKNLARYSKKLRRLLPPPKAKEQLEFDLEGEAMFCFAPGERLPEAKKEAVDRMKEFEGKKGLHSSFDKTKRVDLQILVRDVEYQVETVTDFETGKSVRAPMDHVGPAGHQMTWHAIANIIKLHVGFAIPLNRLSLIIGQPEFSSGKMTRVLRFAAELVLPIYLHLIEELSDSAHMWGDDTKTKVLDLQIAEEDEKDLEEEKTNISKAIEESLGWSWPRSDGKGDKKGLNVSLLIGRTNQKDPRSTIRFFRTHLGSVGNILTKVLEMRSPKAGPLVFQGDLSTTNLPSKELAEKFDLQVAGCGAHARRPFWRYKDEDPNLCYYVLKCFLLLSHVEKIIDSKGRTRENILKYRQRYGRMLWQVIYNRCVGAVTGKCAGRYTIKKGWTEPDVWPPGSDLHQACMYVINHFDALTLYLDNPSLHYTNNGSERALRIEKCMLSGSKFRKTRDGRAVLDVLRTINATCTAAGIDPTDYLRYISKHQNHLHEAPERYTPYAVALVFEEKKSHKS